MFLGKEDKQNSFVQRDGYVSKLNDCDKDLVFVVYYLQNRMH